MVNTKIFSLITLLFFVLSGVSLSEPPKKIQQLKSTKTHDKGKTRKKKSQKQKQLPAPKLRQADKSTKTQDITEINKKSEEKVPQTTDIQDNQKQILEDKIIEELKNWDKNLESLKANFQQEVEFSQAGLKQHIEGIIHYLKPTFLRIEHVKPSRQIIITDKNDLWIYRVEDYQVVKTKWNSWKENQNYNFSGLLDFGDYSKIVEKNNIKTNKNESTGCIDAIFTSKENPELYTLVLFISTTDYFPLGANLKVDKVSIKTKLENIEKNIILSTDTFKFIPPKGTEVLEFN